MKYQNKQIITEKDTPLCIREINENIRNVFEGKALTRPLATLNRNCEFKKRYNIACDLKEGDLAKQKQKEYYQRPEVKQKRKEYQKEQQNEMPKQAMQSPKSYKIRKISIF